MSEPKDKPCQASREKNKITPEEEFKTSQKGKEKEDDSEQINIRSLLQTKRDFESKFIIPTKFQI